MHAALFNTLVTCSVLLVVSVLFVKWLWNQWG